MTDLDWKKRKKMWIISILLVVLLFVAFWNQPVYKKYIIYSNKIERNLKIVQLSDLHSSIYGKNQEKLINMVKASKPDLILLTGDIVDDVESEEGAYLLIDGLINEYPMYYISGNHETWHHSPDKIYNELENKGVIILKDLYSRITINGETIILAGIMDVEGGRRGVSESEIIEKLDETELKKDEDANKGIYTILMAHRPEFQEIYNNYPIDIALCGHAHGGQVRIPYLINGLYAPDQGLFPKYAGGVYDFENYKMIVSRGLSFNIRLPRIFNPPEVVILTFIGGEDEKKNF